MSHEFYSLAIEQIIKETADAVTIQLQVPNDLTNTFQFKSGQYLTVKFMLKGKEYRRSYSMSSAPHEQKLCFTVKKVPAGIGANVNFIDRVDGFKKAVTVLDEALAAVAADPISAAFTANVPAGIDIANTLLALKARYSLYAGLYPQALAAANLVDLSKKSTFNYDATNLNPVFEVATSTNNVVQAKDSTLGLLVGLQPDFADKRIAFYTSINPIIAPRFRINGFFNAAATAIPVYLPGEMTLIKAECYARASTPDLANSLTELNKVITKVPATDPFGVGAQLPAAIGVFTQAQLLDSIYKHRSIEMFMSGQKLEDMRRFNRPNAERRRNLMPYPLRERDNNPNTPPDPPF